MCAALKVLAGCWAVHLQGRGGGRKEGAASCPAALCCSPLHSPAHRVAALPAISMAVWGCLCPQGCRGGTETRWRAEDRRVSCSGSILVRMPICKAEGKEGRKKGAASCPAALCCPPLHSPAHRVAALPAISMAVWGCLCPQGCRGGTETRWRAEDRRVSCSGSILVRMPICKAEGKEGRKKGAASCPAALCCPPLHSPAHRVAVPRAVWKGPLQSAGPVPAPAVGSGLSKAAANVGAGPGVLGELPGSLGSEAGSSLGATSVCCG